MDLIVTLMLYNSVVRNVCFFVRFHWNGTFKGVNVPSWSNDNVMALMLKQSGGLASIVSFLVAKSFLYP